MKLGQTPAERTVKTTTMEQGPIFIGGLDRCGKTLLRALLAAHPNIAIPAIGSNMWTFFYGRYGDLSRRDNFERCLKTMLRYKHVAFLKPDPDRIRREFWQGEPTYARLFALFQRHYADREGKPRWGDQTGLIERYADQIFAAYPGAQMIHMLRDPRDRYEASLALWPHGKGRVGGATARWRYTTGLARRNQRRYPERYLVVRYETIVTQPEAALREICAFLHEDFFPSMLTEGSALYQDNIRSRSGSESEPGGISTAYIGRFRQRVPPREIAFMQMLGGRDMQAFGYPPEPLRLSFGEQLRFYVIDWPVNLVRLATWRSVEAIQQNFPARLGREPGSRMLVDPHPGGHSSAPGGLA
jgi:hypothetical protein